MCEMLVRVVDKVGDNPVLDAKCTKRGDVIAVCPDGWIWGREELKNPDWRIVKVPGVTVSEASGFLAPELSAGPVAVDLLRRRAFRLDLDGLTPEQLTDEKRKNPIMRVNLDAAGLHARRLIKIPL